MRTLNYNWRITYKLISMRNLDLLPYFLILSFVSLAIAWFIAYIAYRLYKINQHEFYLMFINIYICLSLVTRTIDYIYELSVHPREDFNHLVGEKNVNIIGEYFYHFPLMFQSLVSVWFLFRWLDLYFSWEEWMDFDISKSK